MRMLVPMMALPFALAVAGVCHAAPANPPQCPSEGIISSCPQGMDSGKITSGNDASMVNIGSPGSSTSSSWSFDAPKPDDGDRNDPPVTPPIGINWNNVAGECQVNPGAATAMPGRSVDSNGHVVCTQTGTFVAPSGGRSPQTFLNWYAVFSVHSDIYDLSASNWKFSWTGDCTGTKPTCTTESWRFNANMFSPSDVRTASTRVTVKNMTTKEEKVFMFSANNSACGYTTMLCM